VDDMADTCGTLLKAADTLAENGARSVQALIVHGIFSGNGLQKIRDSKIERLVICNTVEVESEGIVRVLDVTTLLAKELKMDRCFV